MKQLCNCCPSFVDTPPTRHTSTPLDTPRHWQAWYQPRQASTGLDRPRQASTGLDRPRQASTPLPLDSTARHPRHRASTPRHQGSAADAMRDLVVSPAMGVSMLEPGVDARIAPPFMEATDARSTGEVVCVVRGFVYIKNTHSLTLESRAQCRAKKENKMLSRAWWTEGSRRTAPVRPCADRGPYSTVSQTDKVPNDRPLYRMFCGPRTHRSGRCNLTRRER